MANLTETSQFDDVYQLETSDKVLGGAGGIANRQAQQLLNRTKYLKDGKHIAAASNKAAIVDADKIAIIDTEASNALKTTTWANIKATLGSIFAPLSHASRHQHGGSDEIATATPAANAIPKADSSGKLDSWVSNASASTKGKVQLAVASELVTGTDDTKAPTAKQLKDATALDGFWLTKRTKIPDATAPVYAQYLWATTDSWTAYQASLSVSNGTLKVTANGGYSYMGAYRNFTIPPGTNVALAIRSSASLKRYEIDVVIGSNYNIYLATPKRSDGGYETIYLNTPASAQATIIKIYMLDTPAAGDWFEIKWIWLGTDRSFLPGSLSEEVAFLANQLDFGNGYGAKATTTLTSNGTNVSDGDKVTLAGKVYTFKTALTPAEGEVLIGATYTDSLDNLVAAITGGAGNGTLYSCATAHPLVTASRNGAVVTITALQAGILGNQITTSKSAATLTLANPAGGTTTLAGGVDNWGAKAKAQLGAALGAGASVGASPNRTNSSVIGYFDVVDCASGAQVTLPAGGTWAWMVETYGATYGGAKCGTAAGGAAISGTASANLTMYYERIA